MQSLIDAPNSADARCNRRKTFLNEWDSFTVQNESGEHIEESRFRE
jgi:hypothetical protein